MKTLTDRIVRFLVEGMGTKEIPSRSRKYRCFESKTGRRYWVGRAGAVRAGQSVTQSVSLTDRMRKNMMLWEGKMGY